MTTPQDFQRSAPGERIHVMVVDDAPDAAETLAMVLKLDGFAVSTALNGAQALAAIAKARPDCMLVDFGMPDMDGLDLVRIIRERHGDDIILVAVTGWSEDKPRVAETFALVDHHFTKP
eukprot:gene4824-6038_t